MKDRPRILVSRKLSGEDRKSTMRAAFEFVKALALDLKKRLRLPMERGLTESVHCRSYTDIRETQRKHVSSTFAGVQPQGNPKSRPSEGSIRSRFSVDCKSFEERSTGDSSAKSVRKSGSEDFGAGRFPENASFSMRLCQDPSPENKAKGHVPSKFSPEKAACGSSDDLAGRFKDDKEGEAPMQSCELATFRVSERSGGNRVSSATHRESVGSEEKRKGMKRHGTWAEADRAAFASTMELLALAPIQN